MTSMPSTFNADMATARRSMPETMTVSRWEDEIVETLGYSVFDRYVELYWLPFLGPTATWLWRRCALHVQIRAPRIDMCQMGKALGVGESLSGNAPLMRSWQRLERAHVIRSLGDAADVRLVAAPLPKRLVERLPSVLAAAHGRESHLRRS